MWDFSFSEMSLFLLFFSWSSFSSFVLFLGRLDREVCSNLLFCKKEGEKKNRNMYYKAEEHQVFSGDRAEFKIQRNDMKQ